MENIKNYEEFDDDFDFLDDIVNDEEISITEEPIQKVQKEVKQKKEPVMLHAIDDIPKNSNTKTLALSGIAKLNTIKEQLNNMVFEREHVIDTIIRGLASGQPVLLLGDPGTGKSFLISELTNRIEKANYFQWLLNRTSDPAEILGPYSIADMEKDKFKRVTTGKLPEAEVVFLDEIKLGLLA